MDYSPVEAQRKQRLNFILGVKKYLLQTFADCLKVCNHFGWINVELMHARQGFKCDTFEFFHLQDSFECVDSTHKCNFEGN